MVENAEFISHFLKIYPEYFGAVLAGDKPFEIRKNDRGFKRGQIIILAEYDPTSDKYPEVCSKSERYKGLTGVCLSRRITFVTDFHQKKGYVVFGHRELTEEEMEASGI